MRNNSISKQINKGRSRSNSPERKSTSRANSPERKEQSPSQSPRAHLYQQAASAYVEGQESFSPVSSGYATSSTTSFSLLNPPETHSGPQRRQEPIVDKKVLEAIENLRGVISNYKESDIKSPDDFGKLFAKFNITGSLHDTEENKQIMASSEGRTILINDVKNAIELVEKELENPTHSNVRDKLMSKGFLATGCIAARLQELTDMVSLTSNALHALSSSKVEAKKEFKQFEEANLLIDFSIKQTYVAYEKDSYRYKKKVAYLADAQKYYDASRAMALLKYMSTLENSNSEKGMPSECVYFYNILISIVEELARTKAAKSIKAKVDKLVAGYKVYSEVIQALLPDALKAIQRAEYSDEIDGKLVHMMSNTIEED